MCVLLHYLVFKLILATVLNFAQYCIASMPIIFNSRVKLKVHIVPHYDLLLSLD
jgi:hypothetical protein